MLAALAAPAMAAGIGDQGQVAVSATIATYAEATLTDLTIEFGVAQMTPAWLLGPVVAADMAQATIAGNVDLQVVSNNGSGLKDGTKTLETHYSTQVAMQGGQAQGKIKFNGALMLPAFGLNLDPTGPWTPWGNCSQDDTVIFQAGPTYMIAIRGQVVRKGLMDPAGTYTDSIVLTLTAPAAQTW